MHDTFQNFTDKHSFDSLSYRRREKGLMRKVLDCTRAHYLCNTTHSNSKTKLDCTRCQLVFIIYPPGFNPNGS